MRSLRLAALLVACSLATLPPQVGYWSSFTNALPNNKLPDVPLLGNGAIGILLDAYSTGAARPSAAGPGRANTLDVWIGSTNMWSCRAYSGPAKGMCGAVSLGGVSLSLPPALGPFEYAASQVLANASLGSTWTTPMGGILSTAHFLHPVSNLLVTELRWAPGSGEPASLSLSVTTWVGAASGEHAQPSPLSVGCASASGGTAGGAAPCASGTPSSPLLSLATRSSVGGGTANAPRATRAGLATGFVGGGGCDASAAAWSTAAPPGQAWGSTLAGLAISSSAAGGAACVLLSAEAEATAPDAADPALAAAAALAPLLTPAGIQGIADARDAWWGEFYSRSSVHLPMSPAAEALFAGAQYVLGCTASTDPGNAPPALYGVWVTSDGAAWNGDYTL